MTTTSVREFNSKLFAGYSLRRVEAASIIDRIPADDRPLYNKGPSQNELTNLFNLVQDPQHWKNPIDCVVSGLSIEQQKLVGEAIKHFAGCSARITDLGNGTVHVKAMGYYQAVGA